MRLLLVIGMVCIINFYDGFSLQARRLEGCHRELINCQRLSLQGLWTHFKETKKYVEYVAQPKLPINHQILYHFNLNLNVKELTRSFAVETNDQLLVVYIASLVRSVIALHTLIENKMFNREQGKLEKKGRNLELNIKANRDSRVCKGRGEPRQ